VVRPPEFVVPFPVVAAGAVASLGDFDVDDAAGVDVEDVGDGVDVEDVDDGVDVADVGDGAVDEMGMNEVGNGPPPPGGPPLPHEPPPGKLIEVPESLQNFAQAETTCAVS
jgi:hypothetical protein